MRACTDSHLCLPVPQLFPYSLLSLQILQMNHLCSYLKSIPHIQLPLTFSWISHWLFFPFAPISPFSSYILNHSHHHINISSILKTNEIFPPISFFPAALLPISLLPVTAKFPECCLYLLSPMLFLLWKSLESSFPYHLSIATAVVKSICDHSFKSCHQFSTLMLLNFLQCLKQVTPTSFRHFLHFSSGKLEYLVVFPTLLPVSIGGCLVFSWALNAQTTLQQSP